MFHKIFSNKKEKAQELKITVDYREKNSLIPAHLKALNFKVDYKQLPVADYIVNNIAIERKTLSDFKSSIINKRIIRQLLELKQYPKHLLIIENQESRHPNLHENAFRGFLLSTALEYNIPIIFSKNEKDTAKFLYVLAKKQTKTQTPLRPSKTFLSDKEQIQFILEGFPGIGPSTTKALLSKYKSIKEIANASKEELEETIGKKAIQLHKLLNLKY